VLITPLSDIVVSRGYMRAVVRHRQRLLLLVSRVLTTPENGASASPIIPVNIGACPDGWTTGRRRFLIGFFFFSFFRKRARADVLRIYYTIVVSRQTNAAYTGETARREKLSCSQYRPMSRPIRPIVIRHVVVRKARVYATFWRCLSSEFNANLRLLHALYSRFRRREITAVSTKRRTYVSVFLTGLVLK